MGSNDAAEMLEVAKEECGRLEREVAALKLTLAEDTRYMTRIESERDAAYAVIAAVRQCRHGIKPSMGQMGAIWYEVRRVDEALAKSPANALAAHDREVAATALDAAADSWLHGAWGKTPRRADRIADRMAASQFAGDWLRARATEYRAVGQNDAQSKP